MFLQSVHHLQFKHAPPAGPRPRRAFTMAELAAVILILVILVSIFVPFIRKSRETDQRVRCQANLRALGLALGNYAKANDGNLPRVVYDHANLPSGYNAYSGPYAPGAFVLDGRVATSDVTASLWLLVRGGYASPDLFICPSTRDVPDPLTDHAGQLTSPLNRSNFKHARNLSYSYALPFSSAPGYRVNTYQPGDFVILADKNPGSAAGSDVTGPAHNAHPLDLARANSLNHARAGQSVLYADTHVEFRQNPYCGYGYYQTGSVGDNIYTALTDRPLPADPQPITTVPGVLGRQFSPAWWADSYLVPTADDDRRD